jgi:hypothetical protein
MTTDLPRAARVVSRLIPAGDREWVIGDLIEDADDRGLRGSRRGWWLAFECGAIAVGLSTERMRGWFALAPMRELTAGLVIDGRGALRAGPASTVACTLLFCGVIATLALGVEVLVSALLVAAGFQK